MSETPAAKPGAKSETQSKDAPIPEGSVKIYVAVPRAVSPGGEGVQFCKVGDTLVVPQGIADQLRRKGVASPTQEGADDMYANWKDAQQRERDRLMVMAKAEERGDL